MKEPGLCLFVTHAQHPLEDGATPARDFTTRLDIAAEKFKALSPSGERRILYVPGSVHRGDLVSLAKAGTTYLAKQYSIESGVLHGDDWNEAFRGGEGVYCAADEVDVALQGLAEVCRIHEITRSRVVAVCALGQVARLRLHYEGFGLRPDDLTFVTAANDTTHESMAEKAAILYTRFDPCWRGVLPEIIRFSRRPAPLSRRASTQVTR